jgi:hypothetical protein
MNTTIKGLVHVGLAIGALVEAHYSVSKYRKILNGVTAGYHAHAALFHFCYEEEPSETLTKTRNQWEYYDNKAKLYGGRV